MMGFIIAIHVIACALLIVLVLIQRGRGGGLVESFSGVESMFGTKTNAFLTRITTICATVFFLTCLTLAILSIRQSKSLLANVKPVSAPKAVQEDAAAAIPVASEPKPVTGAAK
ncbi:MAG: preprotein translocase subunit SecG [Candidatus Omnitrophota bacterium]|jgi:preprotein translocase subunit SecG